MAEFIAPQQDNEGYFPNTEGVIIELHRLLSIFLSSKQFSELCRNPPGEGFDPIYKIQAPEQDEITRIILSLAVTARVIDDRESRVFSLTKSNCGTLQKNINHSAIGALDIREACNKIIHAQKVRFDVDRIGEQTYLNPIVYLYGKLHKNEWRATLDVINFCKEYVTVVCRF